MEVYVVVLHDGSWANTGNFNSHVFTDYELAEEQAEWLNNNLAMSQDEDDSDPDCAFVEEFEISESIDLHGEGKTICDYLYS